MSIVKIAASDIQKASALVVLYQEAKERLAVLEKLVDQGTYHNLVHDKWIGDNYSDVSYLGTMFKHDAHYVRKAKTEIFVVVLGNLREYVQRLKNQLEALGVAVDA
jgi:hypothetical protein